MFKDYRYKTIKFLIESGKIKKISEIFNYIPKTAVLKDFRVNFGRFNNALADPLKFKLKELKAFADLFNVDAKLLIDMAYNQSIAKKRDRPIKSNTAKATNINPT